MHRAKTALSTLSKYSESCNTPVELAELCNILLKSIYQLADKKDPMPMKSIYALALLDDELRKRTIKAKYSKVSDLTVKRQEAIMMQLHEQGCSYQEVSDKLQTEYGVKASKSKVYQTIKRMKNGI